MSNLVVGEKVQIIAGSSEWTGTCGTIITFLDRPRCTGEVVREYLVDFGSARRWFMRDHLTETICDKTVKFLRTAVLQRWPVQSFRVQSLTGNRDELVRLLQEEFGFCDHRAQTEADDFIRAFHATLSRARTIDAAHKNADTILRAIA